MRNIVPLNECPAGKAIAWTWTYAGKYARKLIVKNGLPDYECVVDAIVTDFLAGVAWARRAGTTISTARR